MRHRLRTMLLAIILLVCPGFATEHQQSPQGEPPPQASSPNQTAPNNPAPQNPEPSPAAPNTVTPETPAKDKSLPEQPPTNLQTPAAPQAQEPSAQKKSSSKGNGSKKKSAKQSATHHATRQHKSVKDPSGKVVVRNGGAKDNSIQLSPGGNQQQDSHDSEKTDQLLAKADDNLKQVAGQQLTATQQSTVDQIRTYMRQAKSAADAGDLARAHTLALKAHLLSADLTKH
jgi:outer membrane biosynthesis protein TonB